MAGGKPNSAAVPEISRKIANVQPRLDAKAASKAVEIWRMIASGPPTPGRMEDIPSHGGHRRS
jgi:hypothetical protein